MDAEPGGEEPEEAVADAVGDLGQAPGYGEEQEEHADTAGHELGLDAELPVLEEPDPQRAQQGSRQRGQAADHHHHQDQQAQAGVEGVALHHALVVGEEAAGEGGPEP